MGYYDSLKGVDKNELKLTGPTSKAEETAPIFLSDATDSKYDIAEIREYIAFKTRDKSSIKEITDGLRERGFDKITPQKVSELQKLVVARAHIQSNTVKEEFEEFKEVLYDTYREAINALGEYVKTVRTLQRQLVEETTNDAGEFDRTKANMAILKTIPLAVSVIRELRSFMEFNTEMVNTIQTTTKEGVIWSTEQVNNEVSKMAPLILADTVRSKVGEWRSKYDKLIPIDVVENELVESVQIR